MLFILFFFAALDFKLTFLPSVFSTILVPFLVALLFLICKAQIKKTIKVNPELLIFIVFAMIPAAIALIASLWNHQYELNLISLPIRLFLYLVIAIAYDEYSMHQNIGAELYGFERLSKYLVWAFALHSVIVIAIFFNGEVKSLIYSYFNVGKMEDTRFAGLRTAGITDNAPGTAFNHAIATLMSIFLYYRTKEKKYLLIYLIVFVSMFFMARTGIFLAILAPLFFIKVRLINILKSFVAIIVLLTSLWIASLYFSEISAIERSAELVINFVTSGELSTTSTDTTFQKHWKVIPEGKDLYLGTGVTDPTLLGTERTDPGFIRYLWHSGLIGMFFIIIAHVYALYYLYLRFSDNFYCKRFFVALFFFIFIYNMKGLSVLGSLPLMIITLALALKKINMKFSKVGNLTSPN